MAKPTIDDCRCQLQSNGGQADERKYLVLQYNPRCTFHKGPDAGYGYDNWGRPNDKHSEKAGTIGAVVIVGSCLVLIVGIVVWLATRW